MMNMIMMMMMMIIIIIIIIISSSSIIKLSTRVKVQSCLLMWIRTYPILGRMDHLGWSITDILSANQTMINTDNHWLMMVNIWLMYGYYMVNDG